MEGPKPLLTGSGPRELDLTSTDLCAIFKRYKTTPITVVVSSHPYTPLVQVVSFLRALNGAQPLKRHEAPYSIFRELELHLHKIDEAQWSIEELSIEALEECALWCQLENDLLAQKLSVLAISIDFSINTDVKM